jgi:hypothetical protein
MAAFTPNTAILFTNKQNQKSKRPPTHKAAINASKNFISLISI